ncbi:MAG: hypothetical protein Kow0069_13240 [Promethearchaeota archaeon]
MRDHLLGSSVEKRGPAFTFAVNVVDGSGSPLEAVIRIRGKWDRQPAVYRNVTSATYVSRFQMDLSDLQVDVQRGMVAKRFDPPTSNPLTVVVRAPAPKPAPVKTRPVTPSPPPEREPAPRNEGRVQVVVKRVEEVVEDILDQSGDEAPDLPDLQDDVLEPDPDELVNFALRRVKNQRETDVIQEAHASLSNGDVPALLRAAKKLATRLNHALRQHSRGLPLLAYSTKGAGPVAWRRVVRSLSTGNPRLVRRVTARRPDRRVLVLVDLSGSTNLFSSGRGFGGGSLTFRVKEAIFLAALTIVLVALESGGRASVYFFADGRNPNHCANVEFTRERLKAAAADLIRRQAGGSTRLDQLLEHLLERPLASPKERRKVDAAFVLADGAPVGPEERPDEDDRIQSRCVALLRELERWFPTFVLWGRSADNPSGVDDSFFKWLSASVHSPVMDVGSFDQFSRVAHRAWLGGARGVKRDRVQLLPYNTDHSKFPFDPGRSGVRLAKTLDAPTADGKVNNVVRWVVENVKYQLPDPMARNYRTASEVFRDRRGCCGEVSNLICGFLRVLGVPAGICDVRYLGTVRIYHACVGYIDGGRAKLVDVCVGSARTAILGHEEPVSDARWARLMNYWRSEPGAVGEALESERGEGGNGPAEELVVVKL